MKMKQITMGLMGLLVAHAALAKSPVITCKGQGNSGVVIESLVMDSKTIELKFSVNGAEPVVKVYKTLTFLKKNGATDLSKTAYYIDGNVSGRSDDYDDISIPAYGLYKSGFGSNFAFNIGADDSTRVFGTVSCF